MTKKKSIWTFVLALCLIFPAMLMLTACGKDDKGGETPHVHTYDTEWSSDDTHHWYKATCEHTDEKKDYSEHEFGSWHVTTEAGYGTAGSQERLCSVCNYKDTESISPLDAKENKVTVDDIDFTYNGESQAINSLIKASNTAGMVVKYKGIGDTTYAESTTAPTNAGSYHYEITIPATDEWKAGTESGDFEIKKYAVACPEYFETKLLAGETATNRVHEISLGDVEINGSDTLTLTYTGQAQKSGRMLVYTSNIQYDPNFIVTGLTASKTKEWIVLDANNEFGFRVTGPITAGSYYQGNIVHGYVRVGDTMKLVGTNSSGAIVISDIIITKIEYQARYGVESFGDYLETSVATYDNVNDNNNAKIEFTKKNSAAITSYDYIVSAKDYGKVNELKTSEPYNVSLKSSEYSVISATIETTSSIKLTVSNSDSCKVKLFNASTGAEITMEGNKFSVAENTNVIIVVKQSTTSATHEITLNAIKLAV